jgi:hypothetical protein
VSKKGKEHHPKPLLTALKKLRAVLIRLKSDCKNPFIIKMPALT